MDPVASDASELFAIGIVADAEYLAPRICFRLTQTNEFMSIRTELLPVASSSPSGPFDSSRE